MTQKQVIIQAKMAHEDEFLKKCVLLIFGQQEADEKSAKSTHHDNGMGFNKADANFLSEMAIVYKNAWDLVIPSVAAQQIPEVRKRMVKYAGQLTHLIQDNEL